MKKFKELTPEDFPGYDPVKIGEWMTAVRAANKNLLISNMALLFLFILISIALEAIAYPGLLLIIFIPLIINSKVRKLEKELNLTREIVMKARRGELIKTSSTDNTSQHEEINEKYTNQENPKNGVMKLRKGRILGLILTTFVVWLISPTIITLTIFNSNSKVGLLSESGVQDMAKTYTFAYILFSISILVVFLVVIIIGTRPGRWLRNKISA